MNIRIRWHILALLAMLGAAVVAAVLELGPPTRTARISTETVTATRGVVQSTVTGTGNIQAGTDVEANFQTSGALQSIYVKDGDHVVKGQLLATLDPTAAQLTLDQAEESLAAAEDNLTNAEAQTTTSSPSTGTSLDGPQGSTEFVALSPAQTTTTQTTTTQTTTTQRTTTQRTPTGTTTRSSTTPSASTAPRTSTGASTGAGGGSASGSGSGSGQTTTTSAATIAANIASAEASVDGARATVQNAENALHQTHLYAPATGTVVNVADVSPGDAVSGASGSSSASDASASASSSGATAGGSSTSGSLNGSTSSSSSSSSGLVEIVNTRSMTMSVAFSESDISKVKVGQPATVTLDALSGIELSAHVSAISTLGTTSGSVVSYDATLTLDQHDARVKPGMSASAAVITGQASGVNLPNAAVTGTGSLARVEVLRNGKVVPTTVVLGLVGDSRTQIVSGLRAGDQIQVTTTLPALGSGPSGSSSSSSGTLGGSSLSGAGRFLGGGGAFSGGGGFRGAGGGGLRSGG